MADSLLSYFAYVGGLCATELGIAYFTLDRGPRSLRTALRKLRKPDSTSLVADIIPQVKRLGRSIDYDPLKGFLMMQWDLSEDFAAVATDEYGDKLSGQSKTLLNSRLTEFEKAYLRGDLPQAYDSLVKMFHGLITKGKVRPVPKEFYEEMKESASALEQGKMDAGFVFVRKYMQQSWDDPYLFSFVNVLSRSFHFLTEKRMELGPERMSTIGMSIAPRFGDMADSLQNRSHLNTIKNYEGIYSDIYDALVELQ